MSTSHKTDLVCIVCPLGCRLTAVLDPDSENGYSILGNICKRGIKYALEEMTHPVRMITSTVHIEGSHITRLPVRTLSPIPKGQIFEVMKIIRSTRIQAPIRIGEIVVKNVCGTGVDIVATRSMNQA